MLHAWCTDTVTRLRASERESRGSIVFDWSNPERLTITGCTVQPAGTSLSQDGRVLGITDGMTAYLPETADVKAGDRIEFDGMTYDINGEPRITRSPSGRVSNLRLDLKRGDG